MKCEVCQSENLDIRDNGPHKELFCANCLVFIKFLNKKQAARLEHILRGRKQPA